MSERVKAFVNLYAAMGALENYVQLDKDAAAIAAKQNLTLRFKVKEGPDGIVVFEGGTVRVLPYDGRRCNIVLLCSSCEQFNKVVDGKAMPLPIKGLFKTLSFMGKPTSPFSVLTKNMGDLMRETNFSCREDMVKSTTLAFFAMAAALAEIGNEDEKGKMSNSRIADGEISLEIGTDVYATLVKKDGKLTLVRSKSQNPRSFMVFDSIDTAKGLIDGKLDAMTCVAMGKLELKGFVPMLEHLNKILNIVPLYLA